METTGEAITYRPVSRLAVAAAVTGVLSSLALTTPLLWILPLVGAALSAAALMDVAKVGAEKAGRAAALAGLALSVGFGAQAVTATMVSRWIMENRTQAAARAWLDAVRENRVADARSMMAPHLLPRSAADEQGLHAGHDHHHPHAHDHDHEHGDQGDGEASGIASLPAVKAILGCGAAAVGDVQSAGRDEETGENWCARVRLTPCGDGGAVELRLELQPAVAQEAKQRVERWMIVKLELGP